jgi:hypothetical protein
MALRVPSLWHSPFRGLRQGPAEIIPSNVVRIMPADEMMPLFFLGLPLWAGRHPRLLTLVLINSHGCWVRLHFFR